MPVAEMWQPAMLASDRSAPAIAWATNQRLEHTSARQRGRTHAWRDGDVTDDDIPTNDAANDEAKGHNDDDDDQQVDNADHSSASDGNDGDASGDSIDCDIAAIVIHGDTGGSKRRRRTC